MKKALKLLFYLLLFVGITVGVGLSYIYFGLPDVGNAPEIKVSITPDRVKRGSYLANHVMLCMDCHSTRDWTLFSGPMVSGTEGRGERFLIRAWDFREDMFLQISRHSI